jgi:YidC/Oxa1 family membrane protein insertase
MTAIFNAIASLFGYLLYYIYNIVHNYGLAIIIFTILTKIILLPFAIKQQKSTMLSQKMQPLINELQRKYKNDPQKMNEEWMRLTKENNFNPFGGCLISLIQIPIILGMLFVVGKPLTNMIKMDPEQIRSEIASIKPDLSQEEVDLLIKKNMYIEMEVVKVKGILNLDFLGLNLGDIPSNNKEDIKLLIIPILSAVFTYASVYYINGKPKKVEQLAEKKEDETPMPDMRMMNTMLPIMSGFIAYVVPLGLGLYWLTSSLTQTLQQILVKKYLDKENNNSKI